jgi:F0F1-type ATP synthase assembly protein I
MSNNPQQEPKPKDSFLGFSPDNFSELGIKEIVGNEPAITMLMHYYKQLVDENKTLKNDLNTYKTYANAFEKKESNSTTSAILLLLSNITIGFGVNLLTQNNPTSAGWFLLIVGIIMTIAGMYFNFRKDK